MPEPTEDVKPSVEPSATEPEAVETPEQPQAQEVSEEIPQSLPEQGDSSVSELDEKGVPYKNRYMEMQRKYNTVLDEMPQMVQNAVAAVMKNNTQEQKEATIEELERYAEDHPEHRAWVEAKKVEIQENRILKKLDERFKSRETETKNEQLKRESFDYVSKNYPECFVKDNAGRMTWNYSNPLTQQISLIANDPDLKNNPRGLRVAADLAFAQHVRQYGYKVAQNAAKLSAENKALQKQTMVEGGGKNAPQSNASNDYRSAIDRAKTSGKLEDANKAMFEILKAKGLLPT